MSPPHEADVLYRAGRSPSSHVIGHFMRELPVAGPAGFIPYVYVTDVDAVVGKALSEGGTIDTERYPEGNLWVAVIADPAVNRVGIWQQSTEGDHP